MKIYIPVLFFLLYTSCKTIESINYIHDDVKLSFTINKSSADSIHWDNAWGKVFMSDLYLGIVTKESVLNVHMKDDEAKSFESDSSIVSYCNVELFPVTGKIDGVFKVYNLQNSRESVFVLKSDSESMYFQVRRN